MGCVLPRCSRTTHTLGGSSIGGRIHSKLDEVFVVNEKIKDQLAPSQREYHVVEDRSENDRVDMMYVFTFLKVVRRICGMFQEAGDYQSM